MLYTVKTQCIIDTHTHLCLASLSSLSLCVCVCVCVCADCPQVQAIYDYKAAQPDELSLERGDVVKVYRKMGDGKYSPDIVHMCTCTYNVYPLTQDVIHTLCECVHVHVHTHTVC